MTTNERNTLVKLDDDYNMSIMFNETKHPGNLKIYDNRFYS